MANSAVTDRLKELKTALASVTEENDRVIESIDIDGANMTVTTEQKQALDSGIAKGKQIMAEIQQLEGQADLHRFLDSPDDASLAIRAAASASNADQPQLRKTLGELFVESAEYKTMKAQGAAKTDTPWKVEGIDLGSAFAPRGVRPSNERKDIWTGDTAGTFNGVGTTTTTPFGMLPIQVDPLVPLPMRTVRVRDLFPVQQTDAAVIEFFRVTGFTNNASVVPDRSDASTYGQKTQSSMTFTGATSPVRTIAHWETIHRNALDDVPQLQSIINTELLYGLRLTEDAQILNGTGTGDDLLGILNTPGIQGLTRASGDNYADAVRRAMTKVFLAYYEPTGVVLHPLDWEAIELLKTTFGSYVLATNVAVGAVKQVWRLPVVDTPAIAQGTALVGAFGLGATLYDRMAGNIRVADQHASLFTANAVLILAEERLAVATKRPESFTRVTF